MNKYYLIIIVFAFGLMGCGGRHGLIPTILKEREKQKNCEHRSAQVREKCRKAKQEIVDALNESIENAKRK